MSNNNQKSAELEITLSPVGGGRDEIFVRVRTDPTTGEQVESGWAYPPQTDESWRRDKRLVGYVAMTAGGLILLTLPVLAIAAVVGGVAYSGWLLPLGLIAIPIFLALGAFIFYIGKLALRNAKAIPNEKIILPERIVPTRDEVWRQPTSLRYLENELKAAVFRNDMEAERLHAQAYEAFHEISEINGYLRYERIINKIKAFEDFKARYERHMPQLKASAGRILGGEST
jgi:hypothetical protein